MDVPRRPPPTDQERVNVAVKRYIAGADAGGTRSAKPIRPSRERSTPRQTSGDAFVATLQRVDETGGVMFAQAAPTTINYTEGDYATYFGYDAGTDRILCLDNAWYVAMVKVNVVAANAGELFTVLLETPEDEFPGLDMSMLVSGVNKAFPTAVSLPFRGGTGGAVWATIGQFTGTGATFGRAAFTIKRFAGPWVF